MRRVLVLIVALVATGVASVASPVPASAMPSVAKRKSATITATITGAPAGSRMLAVLSDGQSSYSQITAGRFTMNLPKSSATKVQFSLHVVTSGQSYAGSISFGKKSGKKTTWYGQVSVKNGARTSLPAITFSTDFGAATLSGASAKLSLAVPLKKVAANGRPAGAGRFGLGGGVSPAGVRSSSVSASGGSGDTGPGADLDSDGVPNSLDVDDNGNGIADVADKASSARGAAPTAKYDAISSIGSNVLGAVNYNVFRDTYPDVAELTKALSRAVDFSFILGVRAVAPFFGADMGVYIRAAWVDCTGLPWCLTADDTSDPANTVTAPVIEPTGDGEVDTLWQYAFPSVPGNQCNVHGGDCRKVKWAEFSMKGFLTSAKAAGDTRVTNKILAQVADQPSTGFGLYDPNALKSPPAGKSKDVNSMGFDLGARVGPHGGAKLLDNLRPGDVFTINAILSDGTTRSIAMTIAPYFITAPTAVSVTPGGGSATPVDYTKSLAGGTCAGIDDPTCPKGANVNPYVVSPGTPQMDITFWRPQRLRIDGVDDAIPGGEPLVDMGHLDYQVQVNSKPCPNSALTFAGSDGGTWAEVPLPANPMSNDSEFWNDRSDDARAAVSRTVTVHIDLSKCPGVNPVAGMTRYFLSVGAYSQPTFGGNRGSTIHSVYFRFN